jgi:formylglycine-generating enzyme required for sulfatase activity
MKLFSSIQMILAAAIIFLVSVSAAMADSFGTEGKQFTIDFVPISGATNPTSGFGIVRNDYRMGTYEITNAQWDKFVASYGVPTGSPANAYDQNSTLTGANVPINNVSWYEAAQFVNWLNTSTGHPAAYNFTGAPGGVDYALGVWSAGEAAGGTNLYRNKNAYYFLPTENEWVKAAYWNGTSKQNYATKAGESLTQGHGTSKTGWNYYDGVDYSTSPAGPWVVGNGSQELNGTYDMMGNIWEWMESPYTDTSYGTSSMRGLRGGSWGNTQYGFVSSARFNDLPASESSSGGFRVASVPEASSLVMLVCGAIPGIIWWRALKRL